MARKLPDMMEQLNYALQAQGFDYDAATVAVCEAIVQCLPSHGALLTLALEAAKRERDHEAEERQRGHDNHHAALSEIADDDLPW